MWRGWGPAAWGGGSGAARTRGPGERPLHSPACSGFLATRRHSSQQPLLLTRGIGDYDAQSAPRPRRADYKSHNAQHTLS